MKYTDEQLDDMTSWLNGLELLPEGKHFKNDYAYDGIRLVIRDEHGGEADMSVRYYNRSQYADMLNAMYKVLVKVKYK